MAGYKTEKRSPTQPALVTPRPPPSPLSEEERQQAAATARQAKELMPEVLPMVKELYELGMIDGWRNVTITEINDQR